MNGYYILDMLGSTKSISEEIKILVKTQISTGISVKDVSKNLNISRPSVYKILKNVPSKKRGPKLSYNPNLLLSQTRSAVKSIRKCGSAATVKKISDKIHEDVSIRTLQKVLKKSREFTFRNARKSIILTENQKKNRLDVIKEWFISRVDFNKVIYSDEARFSLDGPDTFMSWELTDSFDNDNRTLRCFGGAQSWYMALWGQMVIYQSVVYMVPSTVTSIET